MAKVAAMCALLAVLACTTFNEPGTGAGEGEIVGRTEKELVLRESVVRTREAPIGNLITDSLRWRFPEADMALQNAGGIRAEAGEEMRDNIPAGDITRKDIAQVLPFGNKIWLKRMSGKQLLSTLERGVSVLGETGTEGEEGWFLHVSGLKFKVDCSRQAQVLSEDTSTVETEGERVSVSDVKVKGEPLDPDREYVVAVCDFIGKGEDGFVELGKAEQVSESEETDLEIFEAYLRWASPVSPGVEGRIERMDNCGQ